MSSQCIYTILHYLFLINSITLADFKYFNSMRERKEEKNRDKGRKKD